MKRVTIILAIIMTLIINNNNEKIIIPNEAIRVRIIANSNSSYDLEVKENLRNEIEKKIYNLLKNITNIDEARKILINNIEDIEIEIEKNFNKQNYHNKFDVDYGLNYFPEKEFKGVIYKEGYYESLVVTIGNGEGNNWWCVLYPPLCALEFDETNKSDIEYQSFISEIINKYL
ncbi:MAG: stage II sporulation protein R [Bacilli bacterium]|nr:stage II sporulation protein R [Bacilli bacterium]